MKLKCDYTIKCFECKNTTIVYLVSIYSLKRSAIHIIITIDNNDKYNMSYRILNREDIIKSDDWDKVVKQYFAIDNNIKVEKYSRERTAILTNDVGVYPKEIIRTILLDIKEDKIV